MMLVPALPSQPSFIQTLFICSPSWVKYTDASHFCTTARFLMSRWKTFLSPVSGCWHAGHSSSLQLPVVTLCTDSICAFNLECNNVQKWKVELKEEPSLTYQENDSSVGTAFWKSEEILIQIVDIWINNGSFFHLNLITTLGQGYAEYEAVYGDTGHQVEYTLVRTTDASYYKSISGQSGVMLMSLKVS